MRRIVVTGPESTGKSTLAVALGEALHARVIPEAARLFAELHDDRALTADDVAPIARLGVALDDDTRSTRPSVVVHDTDLISTVVYARHYYGAVPEWIATEARARRGDLYLLCDIDLPWVPDGVRDRPEHGAAMYADFAAALDDFGCTVELVHGSGPARLASALEAVARHPLPRVR